MKEKFFCSKSYLITYHRIVKNFFDGAKTIKPYRRAWVASALIEFCVIAAYSASIDSSKGEELYHNKCGGVPSDTLKNRIYQ